MKFPKFVHYASHAETLAVFFEALGIHKVDRAPAASAIFLEFLKEDDKFFVRAIYKNDT